MPSANGNPNHYEVLGVTRTARVEDIRLAYRSLARENHPDRHGGRTTAEMVRINEAWRVLSDVQRRRNYDDTISSSGVAGPPSMSAASPVNGQFGPHSPSIATPARFPWKFVLGFFALATLVILVIGAFTEPGESLPIDNIIRVGSCVDVDRQIQEAWEVPCDGSHDSQVVRMVPFDGRCPVDTETFRDRQGLGLVCAES